MRVILTSLAALILLSGPVVAEDMASRSGWVVLITDKNHTDLVEDLKAAVAKNRMGVVTQAGPTATARQRGIKIPENRVIGVFNNDFAVKVLATSTAAMIEAPIRFYLTENADGTATLSYKTPTTVFSPYADEGGTALMDLATELDTIFDQIAQDAAQ